MDKKLLAAKIKKKTASGAYSLLRFVLIFGLAFIILRPIIYRFLLAFMNPSDLLDSSVSMIPKNWSTYYWKVALEGLELLKSVPNTLFLSAGVAILQVISCLLVGYGLGRFKFPGSNLAFVLVIIIMLIPNQVIGTAQYLGFVYFDIGPWTLNLADSFWPMFILAFTGLGIKEGLYIYLFKEQFAAMPKNLEEAAYIDGAGVFKTFLTVMLPNVRTTIATVFLFSFCWQWTDQTYSGLYLAGTEVLATQISHVTVKVGLTVDQYGMIIARGAATLIIMIPLLLLFVFCQKFLVQSIARTGLSDS